MKELRAIVKTGFEEEIDRGAYMRPKDRYILPERIIA